jgi:NADPH:quinone reductase-like Zn-dependent oxidoreductase
MKASVYYENGGPDVLRYEEVSGPECHPNGIVIRVEAASRPCRSRAATPSTGSLKAVIDRTFALQDAAEAHRYIESRQAVGRVLLIP